jgi:transposase
LEAFNLSSNSLLDVVNVLVDGGITFDDFATAVDELIGASVEVAKRSELHTFVVLPKRWVVERSQKLVRQM